MDGVGCVEHEPSALHEVRAGAGSHAPRCESVLLRAKDDGSLIRRKETFRRLPRFVRQAPEQPVLLQRLRSLQGSGHLWMSCRLLWAEQPGHIPVYVHPPRGVQTPSRPVLASAGAGHSKLPGRKKSSANASIKDRGRWRSNLTVEDFE